MVKKFLNDEGKIELQRLSHIKRLNVGHIKTSLFGDVDFPNNINNARQMLWHIEEGTLEIPKCSVCDSELGWHPDNREYRKYCSKKCVTIGSIDKAKETSIKKYGVDHYSKTDEYQNRVKETNIKKYGTDHYTKTDEYKERSKKTNIEKYGVPHPAQSSEIIDKMKATTKEKYGEYYYAKTDKFKEDFKKYSLKKYETEHPLQNKEIRNKIKQTNIEKYGVEYPMQNAYICEKTANTRKTNYYEPDVLEKLNDINWLTNEKKTKTLFEIANDLGISASNLAKYYKNYDIEYDKINANTSYAEKEIVNYIHSIGISNIKINDYNLISPKEIDIVLPNHNLAIEYNGIYWHTENMGKSKSYHLNKTLECERLGIQLLHIYDNEWLDKTKNDIWKSMIKSKLGLSRKIYARSCIVSEVPTDEARQFMEENHLEGFVGGKIKYGLYYNNELVQCIIISKSRFNKNYDYELIRLATKKYIIVVGGISKLLSNSNLTGTMITYANRRFSNGNAYKSVKMEMGKSSPPNYHYVKNSILESRQKYQKHKLKDILPNFDDRKTEWENMCNNGYDRIWDCGNLVFTIDLNCDKI